MFRLLIESFAERLRIRDAKRVDVGEAVVPSGALDFAQCHHAFHRLQNRRPQGVKVNAARFQRHGDYVGRDSDHNDDVTTRGALSRPKSRQTRRDKSQNDSGLSYIATNVKTKPQES